MTGNYGIARRRGRGPTVRARGGGRRAAADPNATPRPGPSRAVNASLPAPGSGAPFATLSTGDRWSGPIRTHDSPRSTEHCRTTPATVTSPRPVEELTAGDRARVYRPPRAPGQSSGDQSRAQGLQGFKRRVVRLPEHPSGEAHTAVRRLQSPTRLRVTAAIVFFRTPDVGAKTGRKRLPVLKRVRRARAQTAHFAVALDPRAVSRFVYSSPVESSRSRARSAATRPIDTPKHHASGKLSLRPRRRTRKSEIISLIGDVRYVPLYIGSGCAGADTALRVGAAV
ncbi:hypothetical protein EVAR_77843_1 [Eumeta japonica]|uniref:Uncharacterized protein n=1 Tax=Eumeta variegata TaxID=151549 RepID=A0A4C1TCA1_EUMVA|nr:hypothetical protein EVAR_77843_1 [Eumeta japonica]